jgi:hypothetical protein
MLRAVYCAPIRQEYSCSHQARSRAKLDINNWGRGSSLQSNPSRPWSTTPEQHFAAKWSGFSVRGSPGPPSLSAPLRNLSVRLPSAWKRLSERTCVRPLQLPKNVKGWANGSPLSPAQGRRIVMAIRGDLISTQILDHGEPCLRRKLFEKYRKRTVRGSCRVI